MNKLKEQCWARCPDVTQTWLMKPHKATSFPVLLYVKVM